GRGGAGNIIKDASSGSVPPAQDFSTPTIKTDTYTTGRGGQGNMATNDPTNPSLARAAQDVEAPAHLEQEPRSGSTYHWGRGGEGNMMTLGDGAHKDKEVPGHNRRGSFQAVVEKGKGMLGLGAK
ncbi:hypothetical protein BAUCODRAFT_41959, partial [Baudoinia panamericana UAMH 10762]